MELNQEFLLETFFSYCKRPLHKKYQNVFNAECPVCKEGKSAGRSRRLFYFPLKNYLYCHNCSKSWNPFEWVKEVTSLTVPEILKRNKQKASDGTQVNIKVTAEPIKSVVIEDLPTESIDLSNSQQIDFYQANTYVKLALEYCNSRRLFTAVNTCNKFFISLTDRVHRNRLVIPFYDKDNQLVCYQSRSLLSSQFPKYLTKEGEKCLFGEDKIDPSIPYIFIFEGPIDAMFVRNAVAMAGTDASTKQQQLLNNSIGYEKIFVYDNDKGNTSLTKKIKNKLKNKQKVFVWPEKFNRFKDINEVCCHLKLDEFSWKFIVENSFSETEGLVKYTLTQKLSG